MLREGAVTEFCNWSILTVKLRENFETSEGEKQRPNTTTITNALTHEGACASHVNPEVRIMIW